MSVKTLRLNTAIWIGSATSNMAWRLKAGKGSDGLKLQCIRNCHVFWFYPLIRATFFKTSSCRNLQQCLSHTHCRFMVKLVQCMQRKLNIENYCSIVKISITLRLPGIGAEVLDCRTVTPGAMNMHQARQTISVLSSPEISAMCRLASNLQSNNFLEIRNLTYVVKKLESFEISARHQTEYVRDTEPPRSKCSDGKSLSRQWSVDQIWQ